MKRKHPKAQCEICPLGTERYVKTWRPTVTLLPVLWVGQAPGKTERITNKPFSGDAGGHHYTLCKRAGLSKDNMPHTNLVQCWPGTKPNSRNDREPTLEEIECCEDRLKEEIQSIKPELIIALGGPAAHSLTGLRKPMKSLRGHLHKLQARFEYDCPVYCCYHPSFSMRRREWIDLCIIDYKQVPKILDGSFNKPKESGKYEESFLYDPKPKQLKQFLDSGNLFTCDLETTGLNKRTDKITGVGITNVTTMETTAIDLRDQQNPSWDPFIKFIQDPNKLKIWQNGSYDSGILRQSHNITDQGFHYDTRLAEQLIHSDLPSDLQHLRALYTDIPPYKPSRKEMKQTAIWSTEKLLSVVGLDAITTAKVYEAQSNNLSERERALISNHLIPLVYALNNMEHRGVLVDTNTLAAMYAQIQPEIQSLEEYFWGKGVNVNSPIQMKSYFGLPNTQYGTIMEAAKVNPNEEFQMLARHRETQYMASHYLVGIYKRLEDGRIHTTYQPEGTGTGRLSSKDPNLQNVPELYRVIYTADPGQLFIKGDYSQVELWVGASLAYQVSGKHKMLDDLANGVDVHYIACQLCYPDVKCKHGNRTGDFTKEQVIPAKAVVFGTFYGRTERSIAIEFGVSDATAKLWQSRLINHYPELMDYKKYCDDMFKRKGYIVSAFGRRRFLANVRQGYNHPVQSTAGDITLTAIWMADQAGLKPVLSVHDDIVFSVSEKKIKGTLKQIKQIMERPIPELDNMVPRADYKIGKDWYNMEEIK